MSTEVEQARDVLRWATGRASVRAVAKEIGVEHSILSRFLARPDRKPRTDVLARLLPYVAQRLPEYRAAHQIAPPAAPSDGDYLRIHAVTAAYHRGVLDTNLRTLSYAVASLDAMGDSLRALRDLFGGATAGIASVADSNILPPPDGFVLSSPDEQAAKYEERLHAIAAKRAAEAAEAGNTKRPAATKRRAAGS